LVYRWYSNDSPYIRAKTSKSVLHKFVTKEPEGLTVNPYVGCQHRCLYCYATYEWSPEFYDTIYAKLNSPELLAKELKKWKEKEVEPVMFSSATDCYQQLEGILGLTRSCVEELQRQNVPYLIITKASSIIRDLELHARYKDKCAIVWSLTTIDEKVKRLIEPSTPTATNLLQTIKRFADNGVTCGVNIDPIIPCITDSQEMLKELVDQCADAGVRFISAGMLRLRSDIWGRTKSFLVSIGRNDIIKKMEKIYFSNITKSSYYFLADKAYSEPIIEFVKASVKRRHITVGFPFESSVGLEEVSCGGVLTPKKLQASILEYV